MSCPTRGIVRQKRGHTPLTRFPSLLALLLWSGSACRGTAAAPLDVPPVGGSAVTGIPITFRLPRASYVTIVIEDAAGKRIRNLCAETLLPPGVNTISWDGYDEGQVQADGSLVRKRVPAGRYIARGLTHEGIHLSYQFSVYSPGTPPWFTPGGTGAWLGDHTPASGIVFLPRGVAPYGGGEPQIAVGSVSGEAGHPQVWLDLDGRKLYGGPKVDGWFGARAMARDEGPEADGDYYAYGLYLGGRGSSTYGIFGLTAKTGSELVTLFTTDNPRPMAGNGDHSGLAIAARNGIVVISDDLNERLLFVDCRAKRLIGTIPVPKPHGVCFDHAGRLYLVSGTKVLRYDHVAPDQAVLGDPEVVVSSGLEEPRNVLVTPDGHIFVTDWGSSHQVKVFNSDGSLQRCIGRAGGPQVGPYDDQRMHFPNGMTIDDRGTLWVTEDDSLPRRLSRWSVADGHFINAIYGGAAYGGGGLIDPADPTRFYYAVNSQSGGAPGGLELKLDWNTGTSRVVGVYMRGVENPTDADHPERECMPADNLPEELNIPEYPVHIGKVRYLISTYNGTGRSNGSAGVWKLDDNGVAWPVAFIGGGGVHFETFFTQAAPNLSLLNRQAVTAEIERQLKAQGGQWADAFITWSDLNGNHRIDPDEVHVKVFPYQQSAYDPTTPETATNHATYFTGQSLDPSSLAFTGAWSAQSPPPLINADGIPVYDLAKVAFTMRPQAAWRGWFDQPDRLDQAPGGWLVTGAGRGYKNGVLTWTYPSRDKRFPPQRPGEVISACRLLGPAFTPADGEAGPMVAVNGDNGAMYLMTVDGLFVQTLGGDMRTHPLLRVPQAKRGLLMDGYSFEDEDFHPQLTRTAAGPIYLVAGKEHSSVFEVEGLDAVKRTTFGSLNLSEQLLSVLPSTEITESTKNIRKSLTVAMLRDDLVVDGSQPDWARARASTAVIDSRASASLAVSPHYLYAFWRTGDAHLLQNGGGDYPYTFKHGGALDLMLGADAHANPLRQDPVAGDLRLLVTRVGGAVRAVLYRPVAVGAAVRPVEFSSPIGSMTFGDVTDISDQVKLAQQGGDYEVSVPLEVLGLTPVSQVGLRGDIGLLRGDGAQTIQRVYWNNTDTSIVSDIPSEAKLQPAHWGALVFKTEQPDGGVPLQPETAVIHGSDLRLKQNENGSSLGFWDNPASYLTWTRKLPAAGTFRVLLTYGCGGTGSKFTFTVNGLTLSGKTESTGAWDNYSQTDLGTVTLPAGDALFTLAPTGGVEGGFMDFKLLQLVPVPNP